MRGKGITGKRRAAEGDRKALRRKALDFSNDATAVSWLRSFVDLDLATPEDRATAAGDVCKFVEARLHLFSAGADMSGRPYRVKSREALTPTTVDVVKLQALLRECLTGLRRDGRAALPVSPVSGLRYFDHSGVVVETGRTQVATFLGALVDLVIQSGPGLRFCSAGAPEVVRAPGGGFVVARSRVPVCGRVFLRRRFDQLFCSRACQNRATQARYRSRHGSERAGEARKSYSQKQRAKLGPKVKVGRRRE